jgi:hypothetical protein
MTTESGGPPIAFPFYEPYATTTLSLDRWFENYGAVVSTNGIGAPSTPYSLCLDGDKDTVITRLVDLSGAGGAILSYFFEAGGAGDAPEAGENLIFAYKNNLGSWVTIKTHIGGSGAMTAFEYVNIPLPADAMHAGFQLRIASLGSGINTDDWFVDDIRVDYAPDIAATPGSIDETLPQEDSVTVPISIQNVGLGSLYYQVAVQMEYRQDDQWSNLLASGNLEPAQRDYPADFFEGYVDEKGTDQPNRGFAVTRNAGGPDDYGYLWIDSDELGGPTFNWIDVSATGTDIINNLSDDTCVGPFSIGFDFPYYGATYNQLWVSSNGTIGFDSANLDSRLKTTLPTATTPNNMIAWLWDDLNPEDADNPGDHVYIHSDGQRMVIQFVNYPEYGAAAGEVITAEVILSIDGSIKLQYLNIASGFDVASGAVGIENATGTDGLEVAYATNYLKNNLAVLIVKPYTWLTVDRFSGVVAPGANETVNCKLSSGSMDEGDYVSTIVIGSNDPDVSENPLQIPILLTVSNEPQYVCADLNGDGSGPDMTDLIYLVDYMFQGGPPPAIMAAADMNGDGAPGPDMTDLIWLVTYMFQSGPPPVCGG